VGAGAGGGRRRLLPITGPACTQLELATVGQIRDQLIAIGIAAGAEVDRHLVTVAAGELDLATSPLISAWGRRPGGPTG
jgi:hypothetical protein